MNDNKNYQTIIVKTMYEENTVKLPSKREIQIIKWTLGLALSIGLILGEHIKTPLIIPFVVLTGIMLYQDLPLLYMLVVYSLILGQSVYGLLSYWIKSQ